MRKILLLAVGVVLSVWSNAQITAVGQSGQSLTAYTNGATNDSIYFYCTGELGTLVATPTGGVGPYDFTWLQYSTTVNNYVAYSTENDVETSTITDLAPGGYRVTITDSNGDFAGCKRVWIAEVLTNPSVNVNPLPNGCGSVALNGQITHATATPYYNPPPDQMLVNDATQITVCFSGTHTFVSDIAFYFVGPTSCGSPTILLSPSPGVCNGGNDISNLCFTDQAAPNLNVCTAPVPLTGTYDSYGTGNTPINWAPLNGCDASGTGWKVQIYDCVGADVGALTDATITFVGTDLCGNAQTITYSTPAGYNSAINDNSCSAATASIFTVPATSSAAVPYTNGFQWSASPTVSIPGATTSLTPTVNPGPTANTTFTLTITGNGPGAACGGNSSDSETRIYEVASSPVITPVNSFYCQFDPAFNLSATPTGGTWSGTGITNASMGLFNPTTAGAGVKIITYTVNIGGCPVSSTIEITVWPTANATIVDPGVLCLGGATPVDLSVVTTGGVWSGTGIIDAAEGIFDPTVSGAGEFVISYNVDNYCSGFDDITIVVEDSPVTTIDDPGLLCIEASPVSLTSNVPGGTWTGSGITDAANGTFDPASSGLGTFTITYDVSSGCIGDASIEIEVNNSVDATIIDIAPLCIESDPIQLFAATAGGVWSGDGVDASGLFSPSLAGSGLANVIYTITGVCSGQDNSEISVEAVPAISILSDGSFCQGGASEALIANTAGGTWNGTGIIDANFGVFDPLTSGVGTFPVTYTIIGLCTSEETLNVVVHALPIVGAGNDQEICAGESATLTGAGATSYAWTAPGFNSASTSPTVQPNTTTTYTVTGTDQFGCQDTDQVEVTVNPLPIVNAVNPASICEGECAELSATGLTSYSWTPSATLTGANSATPTACPSATTVYTVSGTDANGCSGSDQATVTVTQINVSISPSSTEGMVPLTIVFDGNSNGSDFVWDFGNGETVVTDDINDIQSSTYYNNGFYTVTLTANLNGCTESTTQNLIIYNFSAVTIPNVVTVNADSKNDEYRIVGNWIEEFSMQIYNRYGDVQATLDNIDEIYDFDDSYDSWKPRDENSDGTYFYHYRAVGYDGKVYENTGTITVLGSK
jgi:trimeric autotransporter adhesin